MNISRALVDFNAICFAIFYGAIMHSDDLYEDEDKKIYFKYLMICKLAEFQKKLNVNEMIICLDSNSWRKKYFPFYKAKRAISRAEKPLETKLLFSCIDETIDLVRKLNYKVIRIDGAEADDVIASLCAKFKENLIIVSGDKDFQQLTSDKIKLWNYRTDEILNTDDKDRFTIELILHGDTADGIPNVLSDDDTFINSDKRQKPIYKKKINEILEMGIDEYCKKDAIFARNYDRNRKLILLTEETIPNDIFKNIQDEYDEQSKNFKRKNVIEIRDILVKNKVNIIDNLNYLV